MSIQIGITGARVETLGKKNYVVYDDKIVYCTKDYNEAFILALNRKRLNKLVYPQGKTFAQKTLDMT